MVELGNHTGGRQYGTEQGVFSRVFLSVHDSCHACRLISGRAYLFIWSRGWVEGIKYVIFHYSAEGRAGTTYMLMAYETSGVEVDNGERPMQCQMYRILHESQKQRNCACQGKTRRAT